jgi:hypothetical protein
VIYWRDVLHEGPVPAVAPPELRQIRTGYLASHVGTARTDVLHWLTVRDQAVAANRDVWCTCRRPAVDPAPWRCSGCEVKYPSHQRTREMRAALTWRDSRPGTDTIHCPISAHPPQR